MFEYQKYNQYFAQVPEKMEILCERELQGLGATDTKAVYRGIRFSADKATLYRINYLSRLTTRVLAQLLTFDCHSTRYLKKTAANIPWETILSLDSTFAITASLANSAITHSHYAALCLKDGIADYFSAKYGKRPNVDIKKPDVRINLHIERNKAVVSIDTSGESLHKRGYRQSGDLAPMQETLAAALLNVSGWQGETPLWDCMCGSGTILCEALMLYCNVPAQYLRTNFGFMYMPDYDPGIWHTVKAGCLKKIRPLPKGLLRGSDKSDKAIAATKTNLRSLPGHDAVALACMPFQRAQPFEKATIITNPPYGVRIGTKEEVTELYAELGDFLKQKCCGTTAYIFVGDTTLGKHIGLRPSKKTPLNNGPIEGQLLRIDSFSGTFRKPHHTDQPPSGGPERSFAEN
jgi:putative N6-adenine-specific DNA methylase